MWWNRDRPADNNERTLDSRHYGRAWFDAEYEAHVAANLTGPHEAFFVQKLAPELASDGQGRGVVRREYAVS